MANNNWAESLLGNGYKAIGAVTSLGGVAKNPVSNIATNTGNNITNPGLNINGQVNYGYTRDPITGVVMPTSQYDAIVHGTEPGGYNSKTSSGSASKAPNTANQTGSTYDPNAYGGYGSAAAQSAANAALDSYRGEANKDLSTLLGSYNSTVANLKSNYNTKGNQLDSAKANAQSTYGNDVTDQNQDLLRQSNQIRQGVHSAYQNLMNLLGAYGGGGTSVAQQWAPEAAQHFQNAQMGTANQTTAANLRDLNNTWGAYQNQWDNQKKQLADQQNQDLTNAGSTYNDTKSKLDTILGRIGTPGITPSDIAGQLSGISVPRVDFVKPTYTGTTPVYNAPNLSTFEAAIPTASFAQPAAVSNSSATPALAVLLDQQKRQQNQPVLA